MPEQTPGSPDNTPEIEATQPVSGAVVDLNIERELKDSYLTYAMSTIMDRALPDVRDGLKPSQRRILVAMHDLNLGPRSKHRKCAKICGDVSGNYHPHGESVIYPTLVRFGQDWTMRVPLVNKQGNFGSIDGDPPAAMRYTEARMSEAASEMLADLELGTVEFQENYDGTMSEPMVLPGRFPNLLVNGSTGIAVGMACSIPPHNLGEVLDAAVALIDNPEMSLQELLEIIPGPDFPTGGVILGRRGIVESYATGRGRVTVRGEIEVEDIPGSRDRQQLVITSLPYQLTGGSLMEKIADAVSDERIKGVSEARNEADMRNPVRIVCELKKGTDPAVVEQQLYQYTPLKQTFSIINIALAGRRPMTMSLREMLQHYLDHRVEVIRRRTAFLLREAQKKAHILEGLIFAVCDIDEVIRIIRASATREDAIQALMAKRFQIPAGHPYAPKIPPRLMKSLEQSGGAASLTRVQAEAIGAMRLIQLVGLEIERLVNDYSKLVEQIEDYEDILANQSRVFAIIKQDCADMKARFATPRRTLIEEYDGDIDIADLIEQKDVVVTISHEGYVKRVPLETYRQQGRGGVGIMASDSKDEDFIEHVFVASTHDDLLAFTDTGRVFKMKVYELPEMSRQSKGRALVNLVELRPGEKGRAFLTISDFEKSSDYLAFVSAQGIVKRTALKEYRNVNRTGIIAVGLKEGDRLLNVVLTKGDDDLLLATSGGMAIRFNEQDARLMGRSAAGVKGIDLRADDEVIGVTPVRMHTNSEGARATLSPHFFLLTITEQGYGKRTLVDEYLVQPEEGPARAQSRGGKGRADIRTGGDSGKAAVALWVKPGDDLVVVSEHGMLVRTAADSVRETGRGTKGVRVVRLREGDRVVAAARVPGEEGDPETTSTTEDTAE